MIDRQALLTDLQRLLRTLEGDLRERCDKVAEVGAAVRGEYDAAREAERTAQGFEEWRGDYITQIAAAWVLSCVFARFLEDNALVDPPRIAGPGERLRRARDEYELYFRQHPAETDREYLLSVFDELAWLPGGQDVFGEHNLVHEQRGWLSGDAARELLRFFQRIGAASGELVHDFTDPEWDTRFLGDLYQDLSEAARKKYALLQTPEFVEEFILDRTLDPALEEFGLDGFRMIDPACGSGHFLLGSFHRLFDRWLKAEPGTNQRELVQRALASVHGVDLNPYAVAIARFRLLLAALRSCGIERLADAPAFRMNLACGDSLLHGTPGGDQLVLGFDPLAHAYQSEDLPELRRILKAGHYHAVVANPPYITPKDKALSQAYRQNYSACHRKYSLSVPFMQRIFGLAVEDGFAGQITANSFMKREFGRKLIEEFLATIDLRVVIDMSGTYIPGHGTPTVILFGRNRRPGNAAVRTVMGIRGEPATPEDPASGLVWSAIVAQIDEPGSESEFITVDDSPREVFRKHPWTMGGGGAALLRDAIDQAGIVQLGSKLEDLGRTSHTGDDEVYYMPTSTAKTRGLLDVAVPLVTGDNVRDYQIITDVVTLFPYDRMTAEPLDRIPQALRRHFWHHRTSLLLRRDFGRTIVERGHRWYDHSMFFPRRYRCQLSIAFAFVSTHNHFSVDRGGRVFNRHAPTMMLRSEDGEEAYLALCGILNSSLACFWIKQVCHNKGSTVDQHGARQTTVPFEDFWEHDAGKLQQFPLAADWPALTSRDLNGLAADLAAAAPSHFLKSAVDVASPDPIGERRSTWVATRHAMIALQEELDWRCYSLYGLANEELICDGTAPGVELGQRAFEIVLARKMAAGKLETTWFERHGSTPITEIPEHWPEDYKRLVERRIELIESDRNIGLIEQPEYKRRWNTEPWDSQLDRALRSWLLDRLESYFDFDGRMKTLTPALSQREREQVATAQVGIEVTSTARLADLAARDADFMQVAELYRGRKDFDVGRLVAELVEDQSVPCLPVLRYKPAAMDKRRAWERTWELQRLEDAIDARIGRDEEVERRPDWTIHADDGSEPLTEHMAKLLKNGGVGDIPVPPKYKSSDFQKSTYWRLRGKLDVPKERWVSFPHCEGEDGTLPIAWAGYDHLQLARAVAAYFARVQEEIGGTDDPRLVPLLGCILELVPWLKQWHNDIDPEYNMRMGDYFESFVDQEARAMGMTVEDVRKWEPAKKGKRK